MSTLGVAAGVALVLLPAALAFRQLVRRQPQRLVEALLTGVLTAIVVGFADVLLRSGAGTQLYGAITMSRPGGSHIAPLDGYLAGLAAYATIIDLTGRPRWRTALWLAVGVYAIASLAAVHTTVLALLITLLLGRAFGLGVRYVAGSMSQRPTAEAIAAALSSAGQPVTEMRRVPVSGVESRRYAAATAGDGGLDVTVFDRDQQAAGALYRLYRTLRLQDQVSRRAPLSTDRAVERRALLAYAVEGAGVPTPRLRALVRVGPEAVAMATEHHAGTTFAELGGTLTDAQLGRAWDAVLRLHAHRVTHRALTGDRILVSDEGQVELLDPGSGDVAASDLQLRLDVSQLLAELATLVGPDRAADLALRKIGASELIAVLPMLQPVVLYRSTRASLRRDRNILPALRKQLIAAAPGDGAAPVRLERIRLRTLVTLVATIVAGYIVIGQLAKVNIAKTLRSADVRWMIVALGLSALTYVAAALSLSGFVLRRLNFTRTVLAQVAASFVTLVTPAAVGGAALNIRYLQRNKVPPAVAAASVGVSQVVAFVLHVMLLVIFIAITGARSNSLSPPTWAYFVIAGLVAVVLIVVAVPAGRAAAGPARAGGGTSPAQADRGHPAAPQAGCGDWRRAPAHGVLRALPHRLRAGLRRFHRDHQCGRGLPDWKRPGVRGAHARRARRGRGRPVGRPHRHRAGRGHGGQRGATVPDPDLLAPGSAWLGRLQLPAAQAGLVAEPGHAARAPLPRGAGRAPLRFAFGSLRSGPPTPAHAGRRRVAGSTARSPARADVTAVTHEIACAS